MISSITAIILTKNEEINIKDCISSLKNFCSRICVVDSFSTDDTVNIAKSLGSEVFTHKFENYSTQFNWALDNLSITTNWTLRIDADERLTDQLKDEIINYLNKSNFTVSNINGFVFQARLFFMGKEIKHGGAQKRKLMLFKSGKARIENRNMDEHTILKEGTTISCKNKFLHFDFKSLDHFITKLNSYSNREILDYYDINNLGQNPLNLNDSKIQRTRFFKKIYYKFPILHRSFILFLYFYFFRFGFLDGKTGLIYHFLYYFWYRFIVDSKILEKKNHL